MQLPSGQELDQLIRSPVAYLQCYLAFEKAQRLPELLEALSCVPFSPVREARRARVMYRLGKTSEAMQLLKHHLEHRLCMAWHVAFHVPAAGPEDLRKLLVQHPTTWPINGNPIHLEAKARLHLARGVAFISLNMPESAQREFSEAIRFSELLGDRLTQNIALMEFARGDLLNNRLERALGAYRQVVRDVPAHTQVWDYSLVYATHIHWLLDLTPRWLSGWASYALQTLRLQRPAGPVPVVSPNVHLLGLGEALEALKQLSEVFHAAPVQERHQVVQQRCQGPIQQLEALASKRPTEEISAFFILAAHALQLSMGGQDEGAFEAAQQLVASPGYGITQLAMVHAMVVLQLAQNVQGVSPALNLPALTSWLTTHWLAAEDAPRRWLEWWMVHFTPAALQHLPPTGSRTLSLKEEH